MAVDTGPYMCGAMTHVLPEPVASRHCQEIQEGTGLSGEDRTKERTGQTRLSCVNMNTKQLTHALKCNSA